MIAGRDQTYIRKVRVRCDFRDILALRLHLPAALSTANLHPPGLPESAIAFVNKLRDPLPGAMKVEGTRVNPTREWQRAVAESLDWLVRRAARPALGAVPSDAEAVLFLDRSELLACLASDFLEGELRSRWWWRTLLNGSDLSIAVFGEWLDSIEYVPPAFLLLARKGLAARFAARLGDETTPKLLERLVRRFGLIEFVSMLQSFNGQTSQSAIEPPPGDLAKEDLGDKEIIERESSELRTRWAPEAFDQRVKGAARIVLALSLTLERAPAVLRGPGAARRFLKLLSDESIFSEAQASQTSLRKSQLSSYPQLQQDVRDTAAETALQSLQDSQLFFDAGVPLTEPPPSESRHDAIQRFRPEESNEPAQEKADRLQRPLQSAAPPAEGSESHSTVALQPEAPEIEVSPLTSQLYSQPHPPPNIGLVTAAPLEMKFDTEFGGVFYLVNAALALNLYGDFTRPREPGIDLSIWHFLLLMGRELTGRRIEADGIWNGLMLLSGQGPGAEPGDGFDPPDEWRISPDWLDAFPEKAQWTYSVSQGRLRIWHPAGFTVLDLPFRPTDASVDEVVIEETSAYGCISELRRRRSGSRISGLQSRGGRVQQWTELLSGYLRVRLARGLGLKDGADIERMLLARKARVEVTPARLALFFSLADLAVEVRLSGLDRNPGWVPASGRTITFHYE